MASSKRQRQKTRKVANDYATSGGSTNTNPYVVRSEDPAASSAPTPDQVVPGMGDDMGDGTPPAEFPNAGRNGTAMASRVALACFGCGAEAWVPMGRVAQVGIDGQVLTCGICKSSDLDVLDGEPNLARTSALVAHHLASAGGERDFAQGWSDDAKHPIMAQVRKRKGWQAHDEDDARLDFGGISCWVQQYSGNDKIRLEITHSGQNVSGQLPNGGYYASAKSAFDAAERYVKKYYPSFADNLDPSVEVYYAGDDERNRWQRRPLASRVAQLLQVTAKSQRCDVCGHTVRSAPDEQGWDCPICHEGTMQDVTERESARRTAAVSWGGDEREMIGEGPKGEYLYVGPSEEGGLMWYVQGDNYADGDCTTLAEGMVAAEQALGGPADDQMSMFARRALSSFVTDLIQVGAGISDLTKVAFSDLPMDHLTANPSTEEIMARVEAIPLPIKRLPPGQIVQAQTVAATVLRSNPGLDLAKAWKLAYATVTGQEP